MSKRQKSAEIGEGVKKKAKNETITEDLTLKLAVSRFQKMELTWPETDILALIERIKSHIPEDDSISYASRLLKLDWNLIAFNSYSSEDCQKMGQILLKPIRKFRFLSDLLDDAQSMVLTKNKVKPPKKPLNSYFKYVEEQRSHVAAENPKLTTTELNKKIGEMFKGLPEEDRERYDRKAATAREEYKLELAAFHRQHPPKKKQNAGLEKPKRPFDLFYDSELANPKNKKRPRIDILRESQVKWNELTNREKFFWVSWAEDEFQIHLNKIKEEMKINPLFVPEKITTVLTNKEKEIKDIGLGKPERPPFTAFHLFLKMIHESPEIKQEKSRDFLNNYISEKWKSCSDDERATYKKRWQQMWEDYEIEFENFLKQLPPHERDEARRKDASRKPKWKRTATSVVKEIATRLTKPMTPPKSEFQFFCKQYEGDDDPSLVWEQFDDEEKNTYIEDLRNEKKIYIVEYEKYLNGLSKEELNKLRSNPKDEESSSDSD